MSAKHTFTIIEEVKDVLRNSLISPDRVVLPPYQLDRKLYAAVDKVLKELGGKWDKKVNAHTGQAGWTHGIKTVLDSGEVVREKVVRQAFYTPGVVADLVVKELPALLIGPVLEPSFGGLSLVKAIDREYGGDIAVVGWEIDEKAYLDSIDYSMEHNFHPLHGDFLKANEKWKYRWIIMNPPFQNGQFRAHVSKAASLLEKGGTLVTIAPTGTTMDFISPPGYLMHGLIVHKEIPLPAKSFVESGTDIDLKIVVIRRVG